jgi:hypothetical protein
MACYDFSGTFDLQSDLIEIVQYLPPQRLLVTNETTIYGEPVLELEAPRSWFRDYKTSTSTRRTGEICRFGSGAEHMPAGASDAQSPCCQDASFPLEVHSGGVQCARWVFGWGRSRTALNAGNAKIGSACSLHSLCPTWSWSMWP